MTEEPRPEVPETSPEKAAEESEAIARRKLLALGVYVAPAIIGTLLLSPDAQAQTASCGPTSCQPTPCNPVPCDPRGCPPIRG